MEYVNLSNFNILGFGFVPTYVKGSKGKYQLVVALDRWKRLKSKLKLHTRKTNPMSLDERLTKLREVCRGWINSFKYASMQNKLIQIDGWLRNRIRYCIWHHWKKPNKKKRSLIRLGIEPGMPMHGVGLEWEVGLLPKVLYLALPLR